MMMNLKQIFYDHADIHIKRLILFPIKFLLLRFRVPPESTLFPYTTLFRSDRREEARETARLRPGIRPGARHEDRKSTRLNSSHGYTSYAVFCLKKKNNMNYWQTKKTIKQKAPLQNKI